MYYTFTIPKKSGGVRVITAPNEALKKRQRELLKKLQGRNWLSRRAHGFIRGRNIYTNASVHVGKKWVLNMDIKDFFPSLTYHHAYNIRIGKGAAEVCVYDHITFHNDSLPQGAPTSPWVSNYCMRDFDTRIRGLLRKRVSDDIGYTRYADDLTFSSNSHALEKAEEIVRERLEEMGLRLNNDKTRLMGRGQRQEITGLNINSGRPTIPKKYRRKVRALVHRASSGWLITHKQKESLVGMISHIALCHPEEARKYREILMPVISVDGNTRRLAGAKRVRLETKRLRDRTPGTVQQSVIYNRQPSGSRRMRRLGDGQ